MLLNRLLYSRSFSKDYRWVLVPTVQSTEDKDGITELLRQLNDEYDLYDRSKGLTPGDEGTFLFGKSVGAYGVLCRCGPTKYEDALGRRIFALSGLLARHEEKKEFAAALPYLVALGGECLEVPMDLGRADADQVRNEVATERVVVDELRVKLPTTAQEWLRMPHVQDVPRKLRSDDDGLQYLLRLLGSPLIPWMDFAFAAPAQLARKIGTLDVVVGDVGLSVGGAGTVAGQKAKPRGHEVRPPGAGSTGREEKSREEKTRPPHKEKTDAKRTRSGKGGAKSEHGTRPEEDSRPGPTGQRGRPRPSTTPILPDDFGREPSIDEDETLRIRAVKDSSYLDRLLDRVYVRFEAYEAGGYVAGRSERFLLSRNLKRDRLAEKNALTALLEELRERNYERQEGSENDWSEFVLQRVAKKGRRSP